MKKARPGGRTARTEAAVFAAVEALLLERQSPGEVLMVEVATRAGVAPSSLYRRWGDVRSLLTEVAVERLIRDAPLPDSGSLMTDLQLWARRMAASLGSPQGSTFFRVIVSTAPRSMAERSSRLDIMQSRRDQIASMIDRARLRGELAPTLADVTDYLLAPLYMRALFGAPIDVMVADALVEALFGIVAARSAEGGK